MMCVCMYVVNQYLYLMLHVGREGGWGGREGGWGGRWSLVANWSRLATVVTIQ